jgi:hypothetical protein
MSAPYKTIRLTIDLTYDAESMHSDEPESIEWFQGILQGDDLQLAEFGDLGDTIGKVKVVTCDPLQDKRVKALEAENARLRYVLDGVRGAIKTGRNEPLMIWKDQIDIALQKENKT